MDAAALQRFTLFASTRGPRLHRLAVLLTGDSHTAQDLVQDVLASLYVSWRKVEAADDPDAYARRAVVNATNRRFRRRRHQELLVADPPETAAVPEDARVHDQLQAALMSLPLGQRQVVALRFLEDLSVEQTAQALRCSSGTVKSQTSKALVSLRAHLSFLEDRS